MGEGDALSYRDEIAQSWVSNAAAWTDAVRGNKIASRAVGTNEAILRVIGEELPCRVLDVGCGEGWLARELTSRGFKVVGMDGSLELVLRAREGPGQFFHLSYEELCSDPDLLIGHFNRIVCNYSLFEEQITPLLRVLRSKLMPNGVLIIQTLHPSHGVVDEDSCRSGWRVEDFSSFGQGFQKTMPYYFRTLEDWRKQCSGIGLDVFQYEEPLHPVSGRPLSLIVMAHASRAGS